MRPRAFQPKRKSPWNEPRRRTLRRHRAAHQDECSLRRTPVARRSSRVATTPSGGAMTQHVTRVRRTTVVWVLVMVVSSTTSAAPAAASSLFTLVSSCGRTDLNAFPFAMCEDLDANGNPPVDHGGFPIPGVPVQVANIRDNFTLRPSDPYAYLGVGTATAGFGHVGTATEMQELQAFQDSFGVLNLGSVSATAESRDTLRLSAGTTARFGFTLNGPAVGVCDFGGASGAPCDHAFGAATSSFSANIGTGAVRFEVDQQADTRTTQIFGTFDPQTRLLLSDPVSSWRCSRSRRQTPRVPCQCPMSASPPRPSPTSATQRRSLRSSSLTRTAISSPTSRSLRIPAPSTHW